MEDAVSVGRGGRAIRGRGLVNRDVQVLRNCLCMYGSRGAERIRIPIHEWKFEESSQPGNRNACTEYIVAGWQGVRSGESYVQTEARKECRIREQQHPRGVQ